MFENFTSLLPEGWRPNPWSTCWSIRPSQKVPSPRKEFLHLDVSFLKLSPSFDTKGVSPSGNFLYKMRTLRSEKTCIILKDGKLLTSFSQSESQPIWCPGFVQKLNQLGSSVESLVMFWRTAAKENDSIKLQSYYYHHDRLYWITWYNVHWYSM